jgi:DNA polymerase-3 subunit epsilon
LESARQIRWRLWANGAPFASRGLLKQRGYRWSTGEAGRPRAWHIDVHAEALDSERHFLLSTIMRDGHEVTPVAMNAFDRYSDRV